jgi:predicted HNH restriction endonuclease
MFVAGRTHSISGIENVDSNGNGIATNGRNTKIVISGFGGMPIKNDYKIKVENISNDTVFARRLYEKDESMNVTVKNRHENHSSEKTIELNDGRKLIIKGIESDKRRINIEILSVNGDKIIAKEKDSNYEYNPNIEDREDGSTVSNNSSKVTNDNNNQITNKEDDKNSSNVLQNGDSEYKYNTEMNNQVVKESDDEENSNQNEESQIDRLRKEAKKESKEDVPKQAVTSTETTSEYRRSQKIKKYVKSRAEGMCEGCENPAPFTSKTGEPYLHAHHIHELSEGGSDTIDTVIALCPNCHYRVHHGEDGDEFNKELLEIVQSKEKRL